MAGQETYYSTHHLFLSTRAVYLCVLNLTKWDSSRIEYWLSSVKTWAPKCPVLLVGTHLDLCGPVEAYNVFRILEAHLKHYTNIVGRYPVSCKKGAVRGLEELKAGILKIAQRDCKPVPKSYLDIEHLIPLASANNNKIITWTEFCTLCRSKLVDDEPMYRRAARFLHDLGSLLYFEQPLLSDIVVLSK